MTAKVKVNVADLLAAVKARREKMIENHRAAVVKYEADVPRFKTAVAEALAKAAARAENGHLPDVDGWRGDGTVVRVKVRASRPYKPELDTRAIDRLIQTLEMSSEPVIAISADDAAKYLG